MKCPNCGFDMNKNGYCMHCGYMNNGNIIDTKKKEHATMLELYFGDEYDKIIRNQNWFIAGLLGPVYLFCRKHYLVGLLLIILDIIISLFFVTINYTLMVYSLSTYYFLFNRIIWATINNMIYIKLITKRLNKYKEKNPDKYLENIQEMYKKDKRLLIFKYICFGLIFLIIFWFLQNILIYYANYR